MKTGKSHLHSALIVVLAFIFAACSLGEARKNTNGNSNRSENNNASKGAEDASQNGSKQATLGTDAPACRLLSLSELEAQFGGTAKVTFGTDDGEGNSTCSAKVNTYRLKIQIDPPGPGLPKSIDQALMGVKMIAGDTKGGMTIDDSKNFGDVGCYSGKVNMDFDVRQKESSTPTPGPSTNCFLITDGYVILSIWSVTNPNEKIDFDVVKGLLEKAAARRKR